MIVCSMLHEENGGSASLRFRDRPVLAWTVDRLRKAKGGERIAVLCWDDQREAVTNECDAIVVSRGPRSLPAGMQAISASRRWADGWRGGLMQTCDFDAGFHANAILDVLEAHGTDVAVLVDPSAAMVDPGLIDALLAHAEEKPEQELCFMPAAPGLGAVFLRRSLIEKLAITNTHPGKWLHYLPDQPSRDPIAGDGCVAVPTTVARTTHNFRFDTQRQIGRLTKAFESLNGQLIASDAETLVSERSQTQPLDCLPREVVLELNTERSSRAIFRPAEVQRAPMTRDIAACLLDELSESPDVRLTIAGCGDPVESDALFDVLTMAAERGIKAVHVESDLLCEDESRMTRLASAPLDIVSVHLPATTIDAYRTVMGINGMTRVLNSIAALARARAERGAGVPLIVPTFTKCRANLGEMEVWYDQWIRALGCAVIVGPSDYAGQIVDVSVADMSPPRRRPCRRIQSRMMVLSDGRVVACEQDYAGRSPLGRIGEQSVSEIWTRMMKPLREAHACGNFDGAHALCGGCREWNRP